MPFGHYELAFQILPAPKPKQTERANTLRPAIPPRDDGNGIIPEPLEAPSVPPLEGEFGAGEVASATSAALCNNFRIVCPAASR